MKRGGGALAYKEIDLLLGFLKNTFRANQHMEQELQLIGGFQVHYEMLQLHAKFDSYI